MILHLLPAVVGGSLQIASAIMTVGTTAGIDGWFEGVTGSIDIGTGISIGDGAGRFIIEIAVESDLRLSIRNNGTTNQAENALVRAELEDENGIVRKFTVGSTDYIGFSGSREWQWSADDDGLAITTTTMWSPADVGNTRSISLFYNPAA